MTAVYVHIPYCVRKCLYCDFCSVPSDATTALYADALKQEIALRVKSGFSTDAVGTVFFGGGTPTALPAEQLADILTAVKDAFPVSEDAEISVECNPGTVGQSDLMTLRNAGFNRLSIGLQSADDALLARIGRIHTRADFLRTLSLAREAGFSNINVDVMHGLPGQTQAQYLDTLRVVCDFDVQHVSAYALILENGTPLKAMVEREELTLPDADAVADMQDAGIAYLEERGYRRYEVSNFAREGFACRHNLVYWHNGAYLGLGVAAHSSLPEGKRWERTANTEDIAAYLRRIGKRKLPVSESIALYRSESMFETVMLGLRLCEGVDRAAFSERFGVSVDDAYRDAIDDVRKLGWWADSDTHLRLNARGLDMLNSALVYFR